MVPQRKIYTVQNLAEKFKQAKALILADYQGLNVSQISELRRAIIKAGGEFEVVKNTLLLLAAKTGLPRKFAEGESLRGPTAALWIYADNPAPLKILVDFAKQFELPKIKFGFWQGSPITEEKIRQLASLPGIKELQTQLVGRLQSPIFGLAKALNWNLQKLVFILKEVKINEGN